MKTTKKEWKAMSMRLCLKLALFEAVFSKYASLRANGAKTRSIKILHEEFVKCESIDDIQKCNALYRKDL